MNCWTCYCTYRPVALILLIYFFKFCFCSLFLLFIFFVVLVQHMKTAGLWHIIHTVLIANTCLPPQIYARKDLAITAAGWVHTLCCLTPLYRSTTVKTTTIKTTTIKTNTIKSTTLTILISANNIGLQKSRPLLCISLCQEGGFF